NEVYVEYNNDPGDVGLRRTPPEATRLKANVWVELFNPLQDDPPLTAPWRKGEAQLEIPADGTRPAYGIYRLVVAKLNADLRQPDNVSGEIAPGAGLVLSTLSSFGPEPNADPPPAVDNTRVILPADLRNAGGFAGKERDNRGFYVLGPTLS